MNNRLTRRSILATGAATLFAPSLLARGQTAVKQAAKPAFRISLAQWSLNRAFFGGTLDPLNFPAIAKKEFGIEAVEYVNGFFKDKAGDTAYLDKLKKQADDHGVKSLLIMIDGEGALGDPEAKARANAIERHRPWLDAAKHLGCHSIRVNASSSGTRAEQLGYAADGLRRLTEHGAAMELNVIVENHGGLSSDGSWLAAVMKKVDHPRCGTLPDFGNFRLGDGKEYDRYLGVTELMPYAKAVSAKSYDFDSSGNETTIDYRKMMGIVVNSGYDGWVGIEYEGSRLSETGGIRATKALLERILATPKTDPTP